MQRMGVRALYCQLSTSARHPQHKVYPYLLRNKPVVYSNQVWAMDITYVRMHKGWLYLCAVVDWYSRKVLAWRLSNTMDVQFCVDAVQEAITRWGTPAIFNTDQGSQFTSDTFTTLLKRHGIRISMDGKGAWRDNVFVERLWRSIKHEEIYLKAYDSVRAARNGITRNTCSSAMHSDLIRHTAKPPQMRLTLQHCRLQKCKLHDRRDLA